MGNNKCKPKNNSKTPNYKSLIIQNFYRTRNNVHFSSGLQLAIMLQQVAVENFASIFNIKMLIVKQNTSKFKSLFSIRD